jgi:hypothetical protein
VPLVGIKNHLQNYKRDPFLMRSMLGGDPLELYLQLGVWLLETIGDEGKINVHNDGDQFHDTQEYVELGFMDLHHRVEDQFMDVLRNYDDINEEVRAKGGQGARIQVELNPEEEVNMRKIEELYAHASVPL